MSQVGPDPEAGHDWIMEEIFAITLIGNHSSQYTFHTALTHEFTLPPLPILGQLTVAVRVAFSFHGIAEREPTQ